MSWETLHKESIVADWHTHPGIKAVILGSDLNSSKKRPILKFFERKFWPFSNRVTFPKINAGGVDVLLSTAYTLEQGWIDDISLIRWLFWLFPSVRKAVVDPTYFDAKQVGEAALAMADRIHNVNGRTLLEMIQITGDSDALSKAKLEAKEKKSEPKSEKEK